MQYKTACDQHNVLYIPLTFLPQNFIWKFLHDFPTDGSTKQKRKFLNKAFLLLLRKSLLFTKDVHFKMRVWWKLTLMMPFYYYFFCVSSVSRTIRRRVSSGHWRNAAFCALRWFSSTFNCEKSVEYLCSKKQGGQHFVNRYLQIGKDYVLHFSHFYFHTKCKRN